MNFKLTIIVVAATTIGQQVSAQTAYDPQARVQNAQRLLDSLHTYQDSAARLHDEMQKTIQVAETLKGEATDLEIKIDESKISPHLTGAQLKAAQSQFAGDLKAFQAHAQQYGDHLAQFRTTIGECSANAKQYQDEVNKFQLHTNVFHIPNVRPPHICGVLNLGERDTNRIANQLVDDQGRVLQAEQGLRDAQSNLTAKMAAVPALQAQVLNENRRALEEKKLVQEFARLKQEYETLTVEHAALVGKPGGGVTSTSVSGKLK